MFANIILEQPLLFGIPLIVLILLIVCYRLILRIFGVVISHRSLPQLKTEEI